jgi:excisionase family DNA binding protein
VTARSIATTLDPDDPKVRTAAKRLASRLDDDSEVGRAVRSMLTDVAAGERVVMLRSEDEVTPAQAAEMLGVTRQFVDRLCEDEVLAFRRLPGSRHRRIRVQDVIELVAEREQRRAGHEALRAAVEDAGLLDES